MLDKKLIVMMKKIYIEPALTQITLTNVNIICASSFSPDGTDVKNADPTPQDADFAASRINVWED